jgi:hypothetical protein
MNTSNSNVIIINSTPISTFHLVGYIYLIPIMATCSFFINLVCLIVLLHPKLSGDTYKYLLFKTIIHVVALPITSLSPLANCTWCPISQSLFVIIYRYILLIFVANTGSTYASLIEIALSYDRLLIIKQNINKIFRISAKYILLSIVTFGLCLNVPYLFAYNIQMTASSQIYTLRLSEFGNSSFFRVYLIFLSLFQSFFSFFLLAFVNTFVTIEFKKYIHRKFEMTGKNFILENSRRSHLDLKPILNGIEDSDKTTNTASTHLSSIGIKPKKSETKNETILTRSSSKSKNQSDSAERNFTKMILISSISFTFIRLLHVINSSTSQIAQLNGIRSNPFNQYLSFSVFILSIIYFSSNFFAYMAFNKSFRACFREIFHL